MNHTHATTILPMIADKRYFEVIQDQMEPDCAYCYDTFGDLITICRLVPLMDAVMKLNAPCYDNSRWDMKVENGRVYVGRDNPSNNYTDWESVGLEL